MIFTRTFYYLQYHITCHITIVCVPQVLRSQDLRVGQEKESYIGFTQENSIENSVQDCLLYILKPHGPY